MAKKKTPTVAEVEAKIDAKEVSPTAVEQVREASIQARATSEKIHATSPLMGLIFNNGMGIAPPWWSPSRDLWLDDFWRRGDHISGAMYNMVSKLVTIDFHVEARDMTLDRHKKMAMAYDEKIHALSEYGRGWEEFYSRFVTDLLATDNGGFMEIIDASEDKSGPRQGEILSVAALDSHSIQRTDNPEYPVIFRDEDGWHKLHWTRVAYTSSMPSPRREMIGVGFCAVSRSIQNAVHLIDIANYNMEKLGSRPIRAILVAQGGLDPEVIQQALEMNKLAADNAGLGNYSIIPVIGNPSAPDGNLNLVELSSLPDGFDQQDNVSLAIAAIALAFGVDARELFPSLGTGATRADALLQHIKARGKGVGQILQSTERLFNNFILPANLKFVFDFQDDAQDRQRAEINEKRAVTRTHDLTTGARSLRSMREEMLLNGELNEAQFEAEELGDDRLPEGDSVLTLFYKSEPTYRVLLTFPGVKDPLAINDNDAEKMLDLIQERIRLAIETIATSQSDNSRKQARQAQQALMKLARIYNGEEAISDIQVQEEVALMDGETENTSERRTRSSETVREETDEGENMDVESMSDSENQIFERDENSRNTIEQ